MQILKSWSNFRDYRRNGVVDLIGTETIAKGNKKREQQITLKNMSGSFVILLGMFSFVVFFIIKQILGCQMSPDNESSAIVISPVEQVMTRSLKLYRVKN